MGEVIQLNQHPYQWKQIFQTFSSDVTMNVYVNSATGACHLQLVNEDGAETSVNMDVIELGTLTKHLFTAIKSVAERLQNLER